MKYPLSSSAVGQPILAAAAFQAALRLLTITALAAATLTATTYTVTVAGLGGEPDYEQRFGNWARDFEKNVAAGGDEIGELGVILLRHAGGGQHQHRAAAIAARAIERGAQAVAVARR